MLSHPDFVEAELHWPVGVYSKVMYLDAGQPGLSPDAVFTDHFRNRKNPIWLWCYKREGSIVTGLLPAPSSLQGSISETEGKALLLWTVFNVTGVGGCRPYGRTRCQTHPAPPPHPPLPLRPSQAHSLGHGQREDPV